MNKDFWRDVSARRTKINLGVYRGVPYYTRIDPNCDWSAVDPNLKNPEVHFIAYRNEHAPAGAELFPAAALTRPASAAHALLEKRQPQIIDRLRSSERVSDWPEAAGLDPKVPATVTQYIERVVATPNPRALELLLDCAGVRSHAVTLNLYNPVETQYDGLFFYADGREFTPEEKRELAYDILEIENWLDGYAYEAATPLGTARGFCDEDAPIIREAGRAATYIKTAIDRALNPPAPARYKILVPFAREHINYSGGTSFHDVAFSWSKRVLLQSDSLEEIAQIQAAYPDKKVRLYSRKSDLPDNAR